MYELILKLKIVIYFIKLIYLLQTQRTFIGVYTVFKNSDKKINKKFKLTADFRDISGRISNKNVFV